MKKILCAGVLALAGSTSVFAADAVFVEPVMEAPVVVYDWSGPYIGVHIGGGSSEVDWDFVLANTTADHSGSGALGGAQVGYNFQSGRWVFGVEADISASGIDGDTDCPNPAFSCESDVDWLGSARLRAGYVFDNLLIYGTGGFGFGETNITTDDGLIVASDSSTEVGWTLGGGAEYAFSDRWSLKGEYVYYDLGSSSYILGSGDDTDADVRIHTGKIGLNFHW